MEEIESRLAKAEEALDHIRLQYLLDSMIRSSGMTAKSILKSYETYPYVNGQYVDPNQ